VRVLKYVFVRSRPQTPDHKPIVWSVLRVSGKFGVIHGGCVEITFINQVLIVRLMDYWQIACPILFQLLVLCSKHATTNHYVCAWYRSRLKCSQWLWCSIVTWKKCAQMHASFCKKKHTQHAHRTYVCMNAFNYIHMFTPVLLAITFIVFQTRFQNMSWGRKETANWMSLRPESNWRRPGAGFGPKTCKTNKNVVSLARTILCYTCISLYIHINWSWIPLSPTKCDSGANCAKAPVEPLPQSLIITEQVQM